MNTSELDDLKILRRFRFIHFNRHDSRMKYNDWNSIMPIAKILSILPCPEPLQDEFDNINFSLIEAICDFDIEKIRENVVYFIKWRYENNI